MPKIKWTRRGSSYCATVGGQEICIQPTYKTGACATIQSWLLIRPLRPVQTFRYLADAKVEATN